MTALPSRQDGVENRDKAYSVLFIYLGEEEGLGAEVGWKRISEPLETLQVKQQEQTYTSACFFKS